MLVRIRSQDGNFRFELSPTDGVSKLIGKTLETAPDADPSTLTFSNKPSEKGTLASTLSGRTLEYLGIKHGEMIYVSYKPRAPQSQTDSMTPSIKANGAAPEKETDKKAWESVQEDPVDTFWRSKDGKMPRERDARFCRHGANGMCDYCQPLEPYDATYQKENNIKHLSFHAYLRKLSPKSSTAVGTPALPPLNPISYKVKVPCPTAGHPPWPAGICTSCQPSAITLQPQPFRSVDHLEIASMDIVDRFLQAWRITGQQRFGWLIGHYETYDKVPMGVKAVVEAIHEPPQEGELDGLTLSLPWDDEARIRELGNSSFRPLTIVGYIFTDLVPTTEDRTKNVYKRHQGSFFLSSLEVIFAATMQNANPMSTKSSPMGTFSSRFVTAVLTATKEGQVDISAYQVSEQACAMVDADMIEASVDPGIVRVKEEDRHHESARYVPDVFFRYKNEYGLEVKKSAKPCFPVEYLLVNVTHGFPQNPQPFFLSSQFSIENRPSLESQRIEQVLYMLSDLHAYDIHKGSDPQRRVDLARLLSDWHLVTFLGTTQLFSPEDMKVLMRVASSPNLLDNLAPLDSLLDTESWQTLMTFARESARPHLPSSSAPTSSGTSMPNDIPQEVFDQIAEEQAYSAGASSSRVTRICPHCTFENVDGGGDCEVCGLPLT